MKIESKAIRIFISSAAVILFTSAVLISTYMITDILSPLSLSLSLDNPNYSDYLYLAILYIIGAICFSIFFHTRNEPAKEQKIPLKFTDNESKNTLALMLANRCKSLRTTNSIIIAIVSLSTVAGTFIFVYAEDIAKSDTTYEDAYRDISQLPENVLFHQSNLIAAKEALESNKELLETSKPQEYRIYLRRYFDSVRSVEKATNELAILYKNLPKKADQLRTTLSEAQAAKTDTLVFISTLSNKFGSVLILFFFIKILVTIYRYNARLITQYESKILVISISKDMDKMLPEDLSKIFDITITDFETRDKAPTSEMMQVLRNATSAVKPNQETTPTKAQHKATDIKANN